MNPALTPAVRAQLLLQDGNDAMQRDAERTVDFDRTDRDAVALAEIDQATRCVASDSLLERGRRRPATL